MKNTPYQNKIDDLAMSVYQKIPVYRKFREAISVSLKKSNRQTDNSMPVFSLYRYTEQPYTGQAEKLLERGGNRNRNLWFVTAML